MNSWLHRLSSSFTMGLLVDGSFQGADEGQVAVPLGVIDTIADNKLVSTLEAYVLHKVPDPRRGAAACLVQQGADLYRFCASADKVLAKRLQGEACVHDVFDHQDVPASRVRRQVFFHLYLAARR